MKVLKVILLMAFSSVLFSCETNKQSINNEIQKSESQPTNTSIEGKTWVLKELNGKSVSSKENKETKFFFLLKSDDHSITGFAGCNNFFGDYEISGTKNIKMKNIGITLMACPDIVVDENEFVKALELTDIYHIDGETLFLKNKKGKVLAQFKM